jgi:hypothetical protein
MVLRRAFSVFNLRSRLTRSAEAHTQAHEAFDQLRFDAPRKRQNVDAMIRTNEREFQGEVLKWIREVLTSPFSEVTQETGVENLFPDVILWKIAVAM